MDTLDPIYRAFPTYRSLDEDLRGELRTLLAEEARRWIKEDVPAGRTAKVHLGALVHSAIARRSSRPCPTSPPARSELEHTGAIRHNNEASSFGSNAVNGQSFDFSENILSTVVSFVSFSGLGVAGKEAVRSRQ